MADYPILAPTLAAMGAVKDLPQGTEAASKLDDVDRQTRNWVYDFLATLIDVGTGKIKSSAFGADGSLPFGIVRGSNPVDHTQREILQGSIQTEDLADGAVTNSEIADSTIQGVKIADNTIAAAKLQDASVTSAKIAAGVFTNDNIADGAITNAKIGLNQITGDRLVDGTIQNAKMGSRSVDGPQLPVGTTGLILVGGNGPTAQDFAAKEMSGAMTIDPAGVVTLGAGLAGSLVTFARIVEETTNSTPGGLPVAASWNRRGSGAVTAPWVIKERTRDFIELFITGIGGSGLGVVAFKESGKYLIMCSAPAFRTAEHKLRMTFQPNPAGGGADLLYYGTSEYMLSSAGSEVQTRSVLNTVLSVQVTSDIPSSFPYFVIDHWAQVATGGTSGLGKSTASGPGVSEVYGEMLIIRIQDDVGAAPTT